MCANPFDQDQAVLVLRFDDQTVGVALDIENYLVVCQKAGIRVSALDVLRAYPLGSFSVNAPSIKRPACISVFSFEIVELDEAKKLHGSIMTVLSVLCR